jgi:hypothetical protein
VSGGEEEGVVCAVGSGLVGEEERAGEVVEREELTLGEERAWWRKEGRGKEMLGRR